MHQGRGQRSAQSARKQVILKKMSEEQLKFVRRVIMDRMEEHRDSERVKVKNLLL